MDADEFARAYEAEAGIVPIPLRPGVIVRIGNLPLDLTPAEAKRIAAVLEALATPTAAPSPSLEETR